MGVLPSAILEFANGDRVIIHTETVSKNLYEIVPNSVILDMIDKGERAIRRKLREWPYGKKLQTTLLEYPTRLNIHWRWVDDDKK